MPSGGTCTGPERWTPTPPARSLTDIVCATWGHRGHWGHSLPQTAPSPHGQQLVVPFLHRQESLEVDFKYFWFFNLGNCLFF